MARKVGLEAGDIIEAAAALADAQGVEAVTLTSVAAVLGIRSPSLYAHVSGLDGLRRQLALRAAGDMAAALRRATKGHSGLDALRRMAHAYRRFARRHPGLYQAAQRAVKPGEDDELYAALAQVALVAMEALEELGVRNAERVHLTRALRSALHGFVQLEQMGGFGMPESVSDSFDRLVELLLAGIRAETRKRQQ